MNDKNWLCQIIMSVLVILGILAALLAGCSYQELIIVLLICSLICLFPKGGIRK